MHVEHNSLKQMSHLYRKSCCLLIGVITGVCFSFGRVLTKECNLPRPGDKLDLVLYEGVYPGAEGENAVWDFSHATVAPRSESLTYTGSPEALTARFSKHRMYYSLRGDSLMWHGYESRQINLSDSVGALNMIFPLSYGDSCSLTFDFRGHHYIEHPALLTGSGYIKADATGILIMPEGDTIRNVLRVRRDYTGLPKVRLSPDSDTALTPREDEVSYQEYDWYAPGYRYPVVSLHRTLAHEQSGRCVFHKLHT